jgi:hypothetical protein
MPAGMILQKNAYSYDSEMYVLYMVDVRDTSDI